jgi:hypothetical protein
MSSIYQSKYKNKESIVLENSRLKIEFLPESGGKLASFISKETGYEFLVQRQEEIYKDQPYDGLFTEGECSGFDDMFPTIIECHYEDFPWKGTRLPDHGEVWSLNWKHEILEDSLHMYVNGVRLPYKLEKWAKFISENILRIDYKLTNYSQFDMDFLWAAHAMFNIEEGTKIILPEGTDKSVTTMSKSGRMGGYGNVIGWPEFTDANGNKFKADITRSKDTDDMEKYYMEDKLRQGWCALKYPTNDCILSVSFPVKKVPYLGILLNENAWRDLYNIFIEPCTASFDRIDIAKLRGQCSRVEANCEYSWYLNLSVDFMECEGIKLISEDGKIQKI